MFFNKITSLSGLLMVSLTSATPRLDSVKVRWCMALMPLSAFYRKGESKNCAQSYVGTSTEPS